MYVKTLLNLLCNVPKTSAVVKGGGGGLLHGPQLYKYIKHKEVSENTGNIMSTLREFLFLGRCDFWRFGSAGAQIK